MIITNELGTPAINTVHNCDALKLLGNMAAGSVNCVVTSPPYFGLRDYGMAGQIGLEETPQEYVTKLVELFREVKRVLRDDGTFWLNLGDSYASGEVGRHDSVQGRSIDGKPVTSKATERIQFATDTGLPSKNLLGIPWRVAFALQDDGWILRSEIIWHKPAPMPESVTDRPTKSHETIFLFAKSQRYWYDADAISEPVLESSNERANRAVSDHHKNIRIPGQTQHSMHQARAHGEGYEFPERRNKRTVWTVNTEPFSGAHFATFPTKLIEPMILAGCPDKVCCKCGAPWVRDVEREIFDRSNDRLYGGTLGHNPSGKVPGSNTRGMPNGHKATLGFKPTCTCNADTRPGVVYDPFMGSGTTALVARRHRRNYIGSELNPDYVAIARERLRMPFEERYVKADDAPLDDLPLFSQKPA